MMKEDLTVPDSLINIQLFMSIILRNVLIDLLAWHEKSGNVADDLVKLMQFWEEIAFVIQPVGLGAFVHDWLKKESFEGTAIAIQFLSLVVHKHSISFPYSSDNFFNLS